MRGRGVVRTGAALVPYTDRTLMGSPGAVQAAVDELRTRGQLISASAAWPVPDQPGRVYVLVRYRLTAPVVEVSPRRPWYRRPRVLLAAVGGVVALCGGTGYGMYLLTQQVARAAVAAAPALALTAVAVLVWLGLGRAGACCPGLHCPGCRCRH